MKTSRLPFLLVLLGVHFASADVRQGVQARGERAPQTVPDDTVMADDGVRGTLAVRAVQGTTGAPEVGGDEVDVYFLHRDQPVKQMKLHFDEHGILLVGDLPVSMGLRPRVRVKHAGVLYQDSGPMMSSTNRDVAMDVVVYETTDERPAWKVQARRVQVQRSDDFLLVNEDVIAENPGDKTWLGNAPSDQGRRNTVVLNLPASTQDVVLDAGFHGWCCTEYAEGKLLVQMPLMPGRASYRFRYRVPVANGQVDLRFGAAASTDLLRVSLPDDGSSVETAGMHAISAEATGASKERAFQIEMIPAGETAGVVLAGFVTPSRVKAAESTSSIARVIGGVIIGAAAAGAVAVAIARRGKAKTSVA